MSKLREATIKALAALEAGPEVDPIFAGETEDALRAALAEPEQITAPPSRKPLSESELEALWDKAVDHAEHFCSQYWDFARAIEKAHGIQGEQE